MVIGIDIDDTVAKFSEAVERLAKDYDKTLRNTGSINPDIWVTKGRFDWSKEEIEKFESFAFEQIIDSLEVKEMAVEFVNKLKENGNTILFITKRSKPFYKTPYESTKKWLDSKGFKYDKIIIDADYKAPICQKEKVDVFVDDRHSICLEVQDVGIKSIMYLSKYNKKHVCENDVTVAKDWKEAYELINKGGKNEV